MDVAALGLRVDGVENLDKATTSLNQFAAAESGASKAAGDLATGTKQAKPALDALSAASSKAAAEQAKLEAMAAKAGISVGQMKAALRGVPAQFTDIATSLQGGMNPLTVFLQQGGQLKDMFGGALPAARALGGYVASLANPFTIAAAAVGVLGFAYYQGSQEADNFRKALVTTGNASGTTVDTLMDMARAMSAVNGTQGAAAESLALFAQAGIQGEQQLQKYAMAAQQWSKYTGQAVEEVAERFAALQKDPLTAALKLNETTNFLTQSVYEQIRALADQGDKLGAARVAMDAYSGAIEQGSKTIAQNLGYIERAWNGATSAASKFWDAVKDIGRADTLAQQITQLQNEIDKRLSDPLPVDNPAMQASREKGLKYLQNKIQALRDEQAQQDLNAAGDAVRKRSVEELAAFDKKYNEALKEKLTLEQTLDNARKEAIKNGKSEADIKKILAWETEQYNKKNKAASTGGTGGVSELASIQARVAATQQYIKALQEQGSEAKKATEGEQLAYKIQQEINSGRLTSSQLVQKQKELEAAKTLQAAEEQVRAEQKRIELVEKAKKAEADRQNAQMEIESRLQSMRQKQDAELAGYGMGDRAKAEMMGRIEIMQKGQKEEAELRKDFAKQIREAETEEDVAALQGMLDMRLEMLSEAQGREIDLYNLGLEEKRIKDADYMAGFQASLETYLENSQNLYALASEQMTGFLSSMESNVSTAFFSMIEGSKSVGDALSDMARGMAQSVIRALTDMAAKWLVYQAVQLLVGRTTKAAAGAGMAATANAQALMAGINAFASTAAIPIIGPAAAPAAMSAALAVTMPLAQTVSALSLAGMAHDGIDAVPETGTWLLEKGERVTTANTSARLDNTLARIDSRMSGNSMPSYSGGGAVTVNVVEDAQRAGTTERSTGADEEQIINIFVSNIRRGGEAAQTLESTYQLGRAGR